MKFFEGEVSADGKKFGIIVSRFNSIITNKLLEGACNCLIRHKVNPETIEVFKVPGAFEIPTTLKIVLKKKKYDAIICLAAIIRGETPHFDFLATEVSKGIAQLAIDSEIPIGFGIITADTMEQAIERAGGKQGNKGEQVTLSTIEQLGLIAKI